MQFGRLAASESGDNIVIRGYPGLGIANTLRESRPGAIKNDVADIRRFGNGPADSLANGWGLRSLFLPEREHITNFFFTIEYRYEIDELPDDFRIVALTTHLVIYAVKPLRGEIVSLPLPFFRHNRAALDEPPEHGGRGSDVEPGAVGDLRRARRPPEVDNRQIDAALGLRHALQMASEILGVIVDQRHQFVHQVAQRFGAGEGRDDDHKAGIASGENLQGAYLPLAPLATARRQPQAPAGFGVQRLEGDRAKQFEERFPRVVQRGEAARGGADEHDARLHLQRLAQPPAEIVVHGAA